jgi:hypothetical protein
MEIGSSFATAHKIHHPSANPGISLPKAAAHYRLRGTPGGFVTFDTPCWLPDTDRDIARIRKALGMAANRFDRRARCQRNRTPRNVAEVSFCSLGAATRSSRMCFLGI